MWNPIRFNDLPDWLKREWNSDNFQIKTKLVKVYHDESISYKVLFSRDRTGNLHIRCWRRYTRSKVQSSYGSPEQNTVLTLIIIGIVCIVGIFVLFQLNSRVPPPSENLGGAPIPTIPTNVPSPTNPIANPLSTPECVVTSSSQTPVPVSTIRTSNAIRYQNPQKYEVFYEMRLFNTGFEPGKVKIYQFRPMEWETQRDITIEDISPLPTKQSMDNFGNGMYYWEIKNSPKIGESISFATRFTITAYEIESTITPADVQPYNTENAEYQFYTRSDRFIEADDPKIIQLANQVAGTETNPYQIAHSFYDYIIDTYHYELTGRGLLGAKSFMETGKGECGDYTALFVALCRSKGIPSRPIVGYWATSGLNQTHVWGEVYIEPFGWIPVDPTVGQSQTTSRDYYFGNIDNRRVILNKNYNIILEPASPGNIPAPFLQGPLLYCEGRRDLTKLTIERSKWMVVSMS